VHEWWICPDDSQTEFIKKCFLQCHEPISDYAFENFSKDWEKINWMEIVLDGNKWVDLRNLDYLG